MSAEHRDAYLARLGVEAEPPSVDALRRIHRAQVERIAYEVLWIHTGDRWGIDVDDSVARIATQRRGGYCLHLNPALGWLLRSLGYDVTSHIGGVHGPARVSEAEWTNHVVLTVAGLPTDANPSGGWYVDAGLGDGLHEPLPLVADTYQQGPFTTRSPRHQAGWGTGTSTTTPRAASPAWPGGPGQRTCPPSPTDTMRCRPHPTPDS